MCSRKEGVGKTWEQKQRPYRKPKHEVPDDKYRPFDTHGRCRTCQSWQRVRGKNLSFLYNKRRKYITTPRFVSSV